MTITDLPNRIKAKIDVTDSGCWTWTAAINWWGYGSVRWDGSMRLVHRVVYTLLIGEIPEGLELDHRCRTRHCVNPAHLEPVTRRVNQLRGNGIGGVNARKTHCPKGHELSGDNLVKSQPTRECRTCRNDRQRERRTR